MIATAGVERTGAERTAARRGETVLVRFDSGTLTEEQKWAASEGIASTDATVAPMPGDHPRIQWWVLRNDTPVGLLTVAFLNEQSVEVGARFWNPKVLAGFFLSDWIEALLEQYRVVLVRCYRGHWRVKRLLQRGGFRLVKIDGNVEFHTVTRETFLGRRRAAPGWEGESHG